ncbi:hypothetical protein B9479_002727 [Cryptococcus floricola]|uniref:Delta 8-(E)-sphingolipid desaturase n=1 Tax=Cryptococcus floricola TaxID=2591691 RepID=A0A5D3AZ53_9TREE|nr:hypothetical protein B9479_002727 [Cryptococcus floricola]
MALKEKPLLSRSQIAERICQGQQLIICHDRVLNTSPWAPYHPGGALALLHFVGRDATNEIEAYHSGLTLEKMKKFTVGRVELGKGGWLPLTPPFALGLVKHPDGVKGHWAKEGDVALGQQIFQQAISLDPAKAPIPSLPNPNPAKSDTEVITIEPSQLEPPGSDVDMAQEQRRSDDYRELKRRIEAAGLFQRPGPLAGYGTDLLRYAFLVFGAFYFYFNTTGWAGQMASATFLGLFYHQMAFVVHDAGHTEITGDWWWDRAIGMTVASWMGGLSVGWWCDNHNIHHLVTNHPEHDPDIQHIPFFAISKNFFNNLWSSYYKRVMWLDAFSKIMIPLQHKLYYVVLSLARFNLYALSYIYLFGPKPPRDAFFVYEVAGVAFYWTYYLSMLRYLPNWQMRFAYLLVSHVMASPVHVQIVLSHFACSTEDLGPAESFPSRQLRTTMDVICSPNVEWIHGGLNLQVTHHLFPRLPRHNLREASFLVKEYCKEQDILYREHLFIEGNQHVLSTLKDVANQLEILKKVADKEIDERMGR